MARIQNRAAVLPYAPRSVAAFHGCSQETATRILSGEPFIKSSNEWDWLGEGIYFWEYAPNRAWEWAEQNHPDQPAVIQARIRLGRCLNLLDTKHSNDIRIVFRQVKRNLAEQTIPLPENRRSGRRDLDRFVMDEYCIIQGELTGRPYQTVRACFPEGEPVFPGSAILSKTHVQIAVRDPSCIDTLRPVYLR